MHTTEAKKKGKNVFGDIFGLGQWKGARIRRAAASNEKKGKREKTPASKGRVLPLSNVEGKNGNVPFASKKFVRHRGGTKVGRRTKKAKMG